MIYLGKNRVVALALAALLLGCGGRANPATVVAADAVDSSVDSLTLDQGIQGDSTATTADSDVQSDTTSLDTATTSALCDGLGLPTLPFSPGPYGTHRHDLAGDFTLNLADGSQWTLSEQWTGCETYVFVPDTIPVSDADSTSIWLKDMANLIKKSPKNAHYFFISRQKASSAIETATDGMATRIDTALAKLKPADADWWRAHLHVVVDGAAAITEWPGPVLAKGHGMIGFGIDRFQRIRGFGMLSDVTRNAPNAQWPFAANLAYAAHEPLYYNAEFDQAQTLQAQKATVISLWQGETLSQFAETDAKLPDAAAIAQFDTLQIEVEQHCPNADSPEPGNCGAWDYLAALSVQGADGKNVEMARFITSYHRETHWLVDATPMLVELQTGGTRHFRWDFAPEWNKQPTATILKLRFSNQNKGYRPVKAALLWTGGNWNAQFDSLHLPQDVTITQGAKKVQLWSIVTGHGGDEATHCAEFCNHQHDYTVSGKVHRLEFPMAGTADQCMPNVIKGMTPNQGGTWWYGRGGWCPGMQVEPWTVDLTADVTASTSATYQGHLGNGAVPDTSGNIDEVTYLVVYK